MSTLSSNFVTVATIVAVLGEGAYGVTDYALDQETVPTQEVENQFRLPKVRAIECYPTKRISADVLERLKEFAYPYYAVFRAQTDQFTIDVAVTQPGCVGLTMSEDGEIQDATTAPTVAGVLAITGVSNEPSIVVSTDLPEQLIPTVGGEPIETPARFVLNTLGGPVEVEFTIESSAQTKDGEIISSVEFTETDLVFEQLPDGMESRAVLNDMRKAFNNYWDKQQGQQPAA